MAEKRRTRRKKKAQASTEAPIDQGSLPVASSSDDPDMLPPIPFQDRCVEHPVSKRPILLPDVDYQHPLAQWQSIAKLDGHVLLTGESGLKLEDIAVLIAANSTRPSTTFDSLDCAHDSETILDSKLFGDTGGSSAGGSCRDGLLADVDGGILLLSDLDQAGAAFQAKLLQFTERGEYKPVGGARTKRANVRIIATAQSSQSLLTNLQYQFATVIPVPPLRDRPFDIMRLLLMYLWPYDIFTGISPHLLLSLCCYSWPGNVLELQSMCKRIQATPPVTAIGSRHILLHAPVDDNYRCFPALPRQDILQTIHTMLMLYALRRHLGLEPTEFRRDETNHTLRLLLEIEDENAGYHPNLSLEKIAQYWESPALYDLSNFDCADSRPMPEYGSLSLPNVLDLLRYYCLRSQSARASDVQGPWNAIALLLERQGPENQPDIEHWEPMVAREYVAVREREDPLQVTWGEVLPPSEERNRLAATVHRLTDDVTASDTNQPAERSRQAAKQDLESVIEHPQQEPLRINIVQLAERLGKSERTIAEWKRRRIIPFEKIGRNLMFDVAAVDAALKKFRRNAAGD